MTSRPVLVTTSPSMRLSIMEGKTPEAVERAIELTEERYCAASAMLGKTATVQHTFLITEAGMYARGITRIRHLYLVTTGT